MKSQKVIEFFRNRCSYHSQVYRRLSRKIKRFYYFAFTINFLLCLITLIESWIHNKSIFYLILLFAFVGLAFFLMGQRIKSLKLIESRYVKVYGNKLFDEISYDKLKEELKHQNLFCLDQIASVQRQVDNKLNKLTINDIKFFAAATVIFGAIFSSFFQPLFIKFNSLSNIEYNLITLLGLMAFGFLICLFVLPLQELSLMLNRRYTRYACLKKLSYLLEEMHLDDEM